MMSGSEVEWWYISSLNVDCTLSYCGSLQYSDRQQHTCQFNMTGTPHILRSLVIYHSSQCILMHTPNQEGILLNPRVPLPRSPIPSPLVTNHTTTPPSGHPSLLSQTSQALVPIPTFPIQQPILTTSSHTCPDLHPSSPQSSFLKLWISFRCQARCCCDWVWWSGGGVR